MNSREAFETWATERGWDINRVNNPSGFVEFKNYDTMKLWIGWNAAFEHSAGVVRELVNALRGLHDDNMDYLTVNHLGGENNHWMKAARKALTAATAYLER